MGNIFNNDFIDFLTAFNNNDVEYLLVGGFSVILHGYPRTTGDMDLWVNRTEHNYAKISKAFEEFGMPTFDMNKDNFMNHPTWDVFTFGKIPIAIDLMVKVKGLIFEQAYKDSIFFTINGIEIRTICKRDLILAKKASHRPKDLDDIFNLR